MTDSRPVLAVDIGGTKYAAGIVDAGGRVSSVARIPTPVGTDAEALYRALTGLIDHVLDTAGLTPAALVGVGVGCGGPMEWPSGVISPLNIPAWAAFPLRGRLVERFPGLPVRIHNDAVAVAVGEHWRGAGRGRAHVLGMVASTGVGGGLVLGNRTVNGRSGNAGHIGHVVVDPDGPPCVCGGKGCLEAIARGPAVAAWAREQGWEPHGDGSARELTEYARRGHPVALAALTRAGQALGVGIASATALCDLDVVALGGGLSQAGPLLFEPLEVAFRRHAGMAWMRGLRVVPAALGQEAGLVGAAAFVHAGDRYWSPDESA